DEHQGAGGDEPESGGAGASAAVSRGPLFSIERRDARAAAAGRAGRRCHLAGRAFFEAFCGAGPPGNAKIYGRGKEAAARSRLARERSGAKELDGAFGVSGARGTGQNRRARSSFYLVARSANGGRDVARIIARRGDAPISNRVHQAAHRRRTRQHDGGGGEIGAAPQQPVSQNAAARDGDGRAIGLLWKF